MAIDPTGVLDEAYERLHRTGPEFDGWLSNHGPMAVEAMTRAGQGESVHHWLDDYVRRLDDLPKAREPIVGWREALGDERRIGDWIELFTRELAEAPWREVLASWWPRLLPGIVAGATHGVIRVGHAVRVLLDQEPTEPRIAELAHGLGYWAARWQLLPCVLEPAGRLPVSVALEEIPRIADQTGGIVARVGRLAGLDGWSTALAALRVPSGIDDARTLLTELVDTATLRYRTHGHGSGVMLVHAVTAPNAVLRTLPALPRNLWGQSMAAAWAASAAVTSVYAPATAAEESTLPTGPDGPDAAAETMARAVRHGDEHAIKFADTAVDTYARTGDPRALAAATRATQLIEPLA
ncbi:questin oxidase family protein [Solihabitans fulvus]|uniref:Questin oxidase family protein n=1 Tax=Solihabitans fulvus TaxID=1892852 RepID=A0A5B2XUY5_9PSEU|nr:questin oxidase family protein [Solihabitans fulvus]KAA2266561.1 questin oxidase family protein [Solihabitans fulvus]